MQEIGTAQLKYSITKGKGNFADLATLGKEGLLDAELASGEKDGYVFRMVTFDRTRESPSMLDITANPKSKATGARSFYTNEMYVIYYKLGENPPSTTIEDRIPRDGMPISE